MISKELLSQLGYGEVTRIGEVNELYTMDLLMFKCDVSRESGRGDGKIITTSTPFHVALEVLAHKCKVYTIKKGYLISELSKYVLIIKDGVTLERIDNDFYEVGDLEWEDYFDVRSVFKATEWIFKNKDKE